MKYRTEFPRLGHNCIMLNFRAMRTSGEEKSKIFEVKMLSIS